MGIASRYNKAKYEYTVPEGAEYIKLCDLNETRTYTVRAMFINEKGNYGPHGVVATAEGLIDMPQHLTGDIKAMRADDELTEAINRGKVGFKPYTYEKEGKRYYSINWLDM